MKTESYTLPQFVETKLLDLFPKVAMAKYKEELPENFVTHTFFKKMPKATEIYTVDGVVETGCFYVYNVQHSTEKEA